MKIHKNHRFRYTGADWGAFLAPPEFNLVAQGSIGVYFGISRPKFSCTGADWGVFWHL